jgi:hypothetical protein
MAGYGLESALKRAEQPTENHFCNEEIEALVSNPQEWETKIYPVYSVILSEAADIRRIHFLTMGPSIDSIRWKSSYSNKVTEYLGKLGQAHPVPPDIFQAIKLVANFAINNLSIDWKDYMKRALIKPIDELPIVPEQAKTEQVKNAFENILQAQIPSLEKYLSWEARPPIENLILAHDRIFGIDSEAGFKNLFPELLKLFIEKDSYHAAAITAKSMAGSKRKVDLEPFNSYFKKLQEDRDPLFKDYISGSLRANEAVLNLSKIAHQLKILQCDFGNQLQRNICDEIRLMVYKITNPQIDSLFERRDLVRIGLQYVSALLEKNAEANGGNPADSFKALPKGSDKRLIGIIWGENLHVHARVAAEKDYRDVAEPITNALRTIYTEFFGLSLSDPSPEMINKEQLRLKQQHATRYSNL